MKYYRFPENRTARLLLGAFLFAMLYLARDTLVTSSVLGFHRAQLLMLGLMGAACGVFLIYNRRSLKDIVLDRRMLAVLVSTAVILLPMGVKRDWQMMYLSILICVYFGIFLSYFLSCREAAKYYVGILSVLGVCSVVALWVLRPLVVDTGIWRPPVVWNQIDIPFFDFGLSFVSVIYVKNRNFGIFREPGVYQYFLVLALFLNNFIVQWRRQRTLWLNNLALAAALLTTLSTAGLAALVLLALVVFVEKKLYRNKWVWLALLVIALLLAVLVGIIVAQRGELYWELYSMVLGKFLPGEDSSWERLEAVLADLSIFLRHPLVGDKLSGVLYAAENNTTSTLILFAGLGILGGSLNAAAWIALIWDGQRKLWANLVLLAALFLSFNTQNLVADVFFWMFPAMALTERVLPRLKMPGTAGGK